MEQNEVMPMATIVKVKNRQGKVFVYLRETYRINGVVKSRNLKSYGQLDILEKEEPGIYERLKSEAKAGLLDNDQDTILELALNLNQPIGADDKSYGWKVLADVYRMLNISSVVKNADTRMKADIDKVLQLLVFQRILKPGSKLFTVSSQDALWGKWDIKEHQIYRSLEVLEKLKPIFSWRCTERSKIISGGWPPLSFMMLPIIILKST